MTKLPDDPESKFAKAIVDGDENIVAELLKSNEKCILDHIDVSKIESYSLKDLNVSQINPLDLAALHNQVSIMDQILDYSLGKPCQFLIQIRFKVFKQASSYK